MMNKKLAILGIFATMGLQAQVLDKVGIDTETPTEQLDVNGTMRVRRLPANGETNAIYTQEDGTAATSRSETYHMEKVVTADANGVLGVLDVDPNSASSTGNDSKYMFVKKIYSTTFPVSGDTGFSTEKWEAILCIIGYNNSNKVKASRYFFTNDGDGMYLDVVAGSNGTWVVEGDFPEITGSNVDFEIVFINRTYMAGDDVETVIQ